MKRKASLANTEDYEVVAEFEVHGRRWRIAIAREDDENYLGTTRHWESLIVLNRALEPSMMKQTLGHELTHAFIDTYGMLQRPDFTHEDVADLFACYAEELVGTRDELLMKLEKAKGNEK